MVWNIIRNLALLLSAVFLCSTASAGFALNIVELVEMARQEDPVMLHGYRASFLLFLNALHIGSVALYIFGMKYFFWDTIRCAIPFTELEEKNSRHNYDPDPCM